MVPDQVEGVAPGPAGDRTDRDQGEDQDGGLKREAHDHQRQAHSRWKPQAPAQGAALLGGAGQ